MKISKRTLAFILGGLFLIGLYFGLSLKSEEGSKVVLAGTTFDAIVVDDIPSRTQGLSGREGLEEGTGMLFVFQQSAPYGFWMKDMLFSIDIIWINENFEIVHIEENVAPETYPTSFKPPEPALYVFEINAGVARSLGLQLGDRVEINLKQ